MSIAAYALVTTFAALSVAVGGGAWWVVGPRRLRFAVVPILAAFLALYLVGHRLHLGFGPTVPLYGFQVSLASDLAFALAAAGAGALAQRSLVKRGSAPAG